MRTRIAVLTVSALGLAGFITAPASAEPIVTVCGSVQVTVNGEDVVNNAACQVLPPDGQ